MKTNNNLSNRLLKYSVIAGAIIASNNATQAAIVGSTDNYTESTSESYNISFNGSVKFSIRFLYQSHGNELGYLTPQTSQARFINYGPYVKALASGNTISSGKTFNTNSNQAYMWSNSYFFNGFVGAGDKYIGVKFNDGGIKYGWIKVNVTSGQDNSMTIISHAYENTGNLIVANGILPVELNSFSANLIKNSVELNWATATEVNNFGFDIERKLEGIQSWEKIGFVQGAGNSNAPNNYNYIDKNQIRGTAQYRLKQIDLDGNFKYSETVEINQVIPGKFALLQNYPNPFNPTTNIRFELPEATVVKLTVYDEIGNQIKILANQQFEAGTHNITFNASGLTSGIYFYKIETKNFVSSKKMILIK